MKLGDIGAGVSNLQSMLNNYFGGNPLVVDGHFGPKTDYYVRAFQKKALLVVDGIAGPKTLAALKDPREPAVPPPSGQPLPDYPPFAHVMSAKMRERGVYAKGSPLGAIVHFTAGRDGAAKTIQGGIGNGYTYWCIQRDGQLFCAHRYNYWGYHAGESAWRKFAKKLIGTVSDDLIGIEINAAGIVTPIAGSPGKYRTYYGEVIDQSEVRYTPGKDNQAKGYYHAYTAAQEKTLIETLMWLKARNPLVFDFDFVLGHDEVAGPMGIGYWRKTDPGAALTSTMPQFRELLKQRWAELNKT